MISLIRVSKHSFINASTINEIHVYDGKLRVNYGNMDVDNWVQIDDDLATIALNHIQSYNSNITNVEGSLIQLLRGK